MTIALDHPRPHLVLVDEDTILGQGDEVHLALHAVGFAVEALAVVAAVVEAQVLQDDA